MFKFSSSQLLLVLEATVFRLRIVTVHPRKLLLNFAGLTRSNVVCTCTLTRKMALGS